MRITGYYDVRCGCGNKSISDSPRRGKCIGCKGWYSSTRIEESKDPGSIIQAAEAELESANFHSLSSLPSTLFKAISPLVPAIAQLELAKAIVAALPD